MILHTTEVSPLPDYRLRLCFNNGECGEVDLSSELDGEVFEPLRDPVRFATARHDSILRTVAWDNGADLAPEFLLELMILKTAVTRFHLHDFREIEALEGGRSGRGCT